MNYYYALNGQQNGPVPEEELKHMVASGSLAQDTMIWREGMADWQPFASVLGASATVECGVCHQNFPVDQTIRYGTVNVCAGCKPRFVQGLREGATTPGTMELAGIGARFGAKFLDNILVGIVQQGLNFAVLGMAGSNQAGTAAVVMMVINTTLAIAYQAVFLHWKGQTLGKMAAKIKVVTPEGGSLSWGKAIARPFAEILSGCILAIGYLMAIWDPEKRTLHDRLVGTRVIKANQ